ncbi:MAG: Uma2 family endonuclease [Pseudanabaena sp.]|jgi:Uma2 family endonuclease|nr:Uma2 family endonuclease [Pseudanabaena sp. M090S1SP2A07QC]MCA6505418.1 Uma2 family endonuclease [Pseudanabaena sp. M172S2SP2A07QC]MCA6517361.1 Uma2 family endonuclease [Pseudanabaena sp. M110S1SP2A07QC]MCA6523277.1 Uma2 family endonuclease [Pseudanabaena sp. M051S1SP2A07QC]MCA6526070.1 Uma2 family endonuclease [Pseudanabaena sp. M179S2SP2A07QC]MCA6528978.1 Uma2 family endonuclease [Pseudanabaena sp. M125S2SP2A07QC]MCA6535320.1 Uma2 family endonuclease [Pseudanabaena sp. M176S2SP2A07QC]MC
MIAVPQNYVSADEYLRWEEQQEEKHEYIDGQVYAMAGASENHVDITTNLTVILSNHLRGKDCKLFPSDMRLNIASKKIYYYPDLLVTCDERDRFNKKQKNYPCLIIEVLSESTESKDRGVKFANYQTIQSLQEYVLISQWEQRVEVFRRSEKFWVLQTYTVGELIEFQSINLQIPIDAIYEDVDLLAASSEAILESTI